MKVSQINANLVVICTTICSILDIKSCFVLFFCKLSLHKIVIPYQLAKSFIYLCLI